MTKNNSLLTLLNLPSSIFGLPILLSLFQNINLVLNLLLNPFIFPRTRLQLFLQHDS